MFAKREKHYPGRSGQTSLATAVTNITKPVKKINSGPNTHSVSPHLLRVRPDPEEARHALPDGDPLPPHPQPRLPRRLRRVSKGPRQETQVPSGQKEIIQLMDIAAVRVASGP